MSSEKRALPPPVTPGTDAKGKKKQKKAKATPGVVTSIYGEQGQASVLLKAPLIRLQDLQDLLLWVAGEGNNPRWAFVQNKPLIRSVVLVTAHGIDASVREQRAHLLPFLHGQMDGQTAECLAPSASMSPGVLMHNLLTVPARYARKQKKAGGGKQDKAEDLRPRHGGPYAASHYRLSLQQLEEYEFPLPILCADGVMRCPDGYVSTQQHTGANDCNDCEPCGRSDALPLIALDCEMCQTSQGLELTRVTLTDEQGGVLLDELVKPRNHIVDYVTRYSGITAEMLETVETRLEDARAAVMQHVTGDTLLVGHSLQNDLHALRLVHVNILDTSVLFPHHKGPPHRSALRVLAERHLRRSIQHGSHDSADDARAAMDLVLLKLKHGPTYGLHTGERRGESIFSLLSTAGRRMLMVDRHQALHKCVVGNCSAIAVDSDEAAVQAAGKAACRDAPPDVIVTQLLAVHDAHMDRAMAEFGDDLNNGLTRGGATAGPWHAQQGVAQGTKPPAAGIESPSPSLQCLPHSDSSTPTKNAGRSIDGSAKQCDEHVAATSQHGVPRSYGALAPEQPSQSVQVQAVQAQSASLEPTPSPRGNQCASIDAFSSGCGEVQRALPVLGSSERSTGAEGMQQQEANSQLNGLHPAQLAMYEQRLDAAMRQVDRQLQQLWERLPANTLLLVCTGAGDTVTVHMLQRRKNLSRGAAGTTTWTLRDEERLAALSNTALRGSCIAAVKPWGAVEHKTPDRGPCSHSQ